MAEKSKTIIAYKGFDKHWQCRGFQYEVGKSYEHKGKVEACQSGFHACEHPLNVFNYYVPAGSRFALVELSGDIAREDSDRKIAASKITIKAELQIPELVEAAVKHVFDDAKWLKKSTATKDNQAASATGDWGAASATGYRGAASATGYRGAATASGYKGRAKGAKGNALFLCERDDKYEIISVWAGIVGKDGIKPDTFYMLRDGKPVECD